MAKSKWHFSLATLLLCVGWTGLVLHLNFVPKYEIETSTIINGEEIPAAIEEGNEYGWPCSFVYTGILAYEQGVSIGDDIGVEVIELAGNLFCWIFGLYLFHWIIDRLFPKMFPLSPDRKSHCASTNGEQKRPGGAQK